jgi:adenosine deaminase
MTRFLIDHIASLSKGELHVRLNGLVETTVLADLLKAEAGGEIGGIDLQKALTRRSTCGCLTEYLAGWDLLRLVPRSRRSLRLLVQSAFLQLKRQNTSFAEIRSSVIYISLLNEIPVSESLRWLVEEIEVASRAQQIEAGLIMTIPRGDYAAESLRALLAAVMQLGRPKTVVGVDLAGNENTYVSPDLQPLFLKAKHELGLGVTIHAGDTGIVENIRQAVIDFGADRIGHGTAAGKCDYTMALLAEHDICVEVCPISNRLTGASPPGEAHPLVHFITKNVPFVICSDNPSLHQANLNADYLEFIRESNRSDLLDEMLTRQRKFAFLELEPALKT